MKNFLNNKYTKTYFKLIKAASESQIIGNYHENHHIIPKSLGGSDDAVNLVKLTARQHFIAHLLLTKMTRDVERCKMSYAFSFMLVKNKNLLNRYYGNNSRWYEYSRKLLSETQRGRVFSDVTKLKIKHAAEKKYLDQRNRDRVGDWTRNPSSETRSKIGAATKNRSAESITKMRAAKSKPCTIDGGLTIFSSRKYLVKIHGWGKNGTGSKNFTYIDSENSSFWCEKVV